MKSIVHGLLGLLLLTLSPALLADEVDKKYSVEARYAYSIGYRTGQSLKARHAQGMDVSRFARGVRDLLQGKPLPSAQSGENDAYLTGYRIGQSLTAQGVRKLDVDSLVEGMEHALQGAKPRLDEVEMNDSLTSYHAYQKALRKNDPRANLADAQAYLAKNRQRPGVSESESGLQYEILKASGGQQAGTGDTVRVHYHGRFADGEVFDSSLARGEPAVFRLDQVIPGFAEALTRMHVGEKWRIHVPPALGYGAHGVRGSIGPNELLIFELELVEIIAR